MNNKKKVYVYTKIESHIDQTLCNEIEVYEDINDANHRYQTELTEVKEAIMQDCGIPTTRDDKTDELLNEDELYEDETNGYFTEYNVGYFSYVNYDATYEIEMKISEHTIK